MEIRLEGNQLMESRDKESFQVENVKNVFMVFFGELKKRIFTSIEEL